MKQSELQSIIDYWKNWASELARILNCYCETTVIKDKIKDLVDTSAIGSVSKTELKIGEVLVFHLNRPTPVTTLKSISQSLRKSFPDNKILLLVGDVTLLSDTDLAKHGLQRIPNPQSEIPNPQSNWVPVDPAHPLPEYGVPVLGFNPDWRDRDYNTPGIRECFLNGDNGWFSTQWNNSQDFWETVEGVAPSHWMPLPPGPDHRPSTLDPQPS